MYNLCQKRHRLGNIPMRNSRICVMRKTYFHLVSVFVCDSNGVHTFRSCAHILALVSVVPWSYMMNIIFLLSWLYSAAGVATLLASVAGAPGTSRKSAASATHTQAHAKSDVWELIFWYSSVVFILTRVGQPFHSPEHLHRIRAHCAPLILFGPFKEPWLQS